MAISTVASSTLTRQRIALVALFVASVATVGYYAYHQHASHTEPTTQLRRRNAVRHRRRPLPDVVHTHHDHQAHDDAHEGHDSDASWTSQEENAVDENAEHTTPRPPLGTAETVADGEAMEDEWYNEVPSFGSPRAGQNIVSLLFRVSEDNSRRNAFVHRGCQCNSCGTAPIRGIRYRCANCADFDLCETCESQGLHYKTHIFYKIKLPAPRLGPRQLQPVWYPGTPEEYPRNLSRSLIAKLSKETGFERPELDALWEQWTFMACTEWRQDPDKLGLAMDRPTFERYLVPSAGSKYTAPNLLHDRIFAFYDTNKDDLIGFSEYVHGTAFRKRKDRLRKIFEGYDVDGDGYVSRRDFLHLFRAYYVLFKQMHSDVVEGLDDQVLTSAETRSLVASRQPLSSLFGRDGFPSGDPDRPIEGKTFHSTNGDVVVSDGSNQAVMDDRSDTAERQEMLTNLFSRPSRMIETIFTTTHSPDPRFLAGILDPPGRVDELPALLAGEARDVFVVIDATHEQTPSPEHEGSSEGPGEESGSGGDGARFGQEDQNTPPAGESTGAPAEQRQVDFGRLEERGPRPGENIWQHTDRRPRRIVAGRRTRVNSRRKLLDRWKRRQFYLDEEEGGAPPAGWTDEEDVLASGGEKAKSPKAAQHRASARPRPSSKVSFADTTDDLETRSNPSTSSRSIPERWGGLDIPEAERDAGREILYQVSQEAFNELLDVFFKADEDAALEAAETRQVRQRYRPLFESIDLREEEQRNYTEPDNDASHSPSLTELLARSGYYVDTSAIQGDIYIDTDISDQHGATGSAVAEDDGIMQPANEETGGDADAASSRVAAEYRDPTMPQFRPNSASPPPKAEASARKTSKLPAEDFSQASEEEGQSEAISSEAKLATAAKGSSVKEGKRKAESVQAPVPHAMLVKWKLLDLAEQRAAVRGGWGRLSFKEFEEIYRDEEAAGRRLDYLGTWIDFCIPSH